MREILDALSPYISVIATCVVAYMTYINTRFTNQTNAEKMRNEDGATLRNDLLHTLESCNKRNDELIKLNQEQQKFIDEERGKRRMWEMENDYLSRQMSRLKAENEDLQRRIEHMEAMVKELQRRLQNET